MKITIVGAGKYGSTLAHRVAMADYADELVMVDVVEGLAQGLALDMNQARPIEGFTTRVVGTTDYGDTAGSDVVVVTAGKPRTPGMSRMDLLTDNAEIVGGIAERIAQHCPRAVVIVVSNPLDEMTALFQRASGFPTQRVVGQAGMLDSARLADKTAGAAGVAPTEVAAITLGSHGDTMVPVLSKLTVAGKPARELLDEDTLEGLVRATREGGAEIVALLQSGSAFYAPASAASQMVQAVAQDTGQTLPACAWLTGHYGIFDVYLGVPVALGREGVRDIIEMELATDELDALRRTAEAVRDKQRDVDDLV